MACSMPPMYWSTGIHRSTAALSNGSSAAHGSQKRKKYQDESTNVSIVSVSRVAGPPHFGQLVFTNSGTLFKGDSPVPVNSALSGSITGKSFSGTGTMPQVSQ